MKINAEGGELILKDEFDNVVIIPKDNRNEVLELLKLGKPIDHIVNKLPLMEQYADDGSIIPPDKKVKIQGVDGKIKEYDTASSEYKDLYNKGVITRYDKSTDTYTGNQLPEINVSTSKPNYMKYGEEYENSNPKSSKVAEYLKSPLATSLGNTPEKYPKRLDYEYEVEKNKYVSDKVKNERYKTTYLLNKIDPKATPVFSGKEKELIKKYNPEALRQDDYRASRMQKSVDEIYPTVNDKAQALTSFMSLAFSATKFGKLAGLANVGLETAKSDRDVKEIVLGLLPYGKTTVKGAKTFFHYADKAYDVTDLLPDSVKDEMDKRQLIADKNK